MSTTQHDNVFTFAIDGLSSIAFDMTDHSITQSQESTWGGLTVKGNSVHILAGRQKSIPVATWFHNAVSGGGGIAFTYGDTSPQELNFGVKGTLSLVIYGITYTAENFVLAQGSAKAGDNNWWVGSPQMSNMKETDVNEGYATQVARTALSYAVSIVTENPVGPIVQTSKLIVKAVKKHYVGSGEIAFTMSNAAKSVELLLFQVSENHETDIELTGQYSAPN